MPNFTVRFDLEDSTEKDYQSLEERLILFNFTEIVESPDGGTYILPRGEYRISGDLTCKKVLDMATLAAASYPGSCKILVTESADLAWAGLKRAV